MTDPSSKAPTAVGSIRPGTNVSPASAGWHWDVENNIAHYSPEWWRMLGYEPGEVEYREDLWLDWMHPDDRPLTEASIGVIFAHPSKKGHAISFRLRHKNGSWVVVLCRGEQVRNAAGETVAVTGTNVDVSATVAAQDELRAASAMLEQTRMHLDAAARIARFGQWEVPLDGRNPIWSTTTYEIHELDVGEPVTLEMAVKFYHPDSRANVSSAVGRAITRAEPFEFEAPIVTAKDNNRWVMARGEPVLGPTGAVVALRGAVRDITEDRALRQQLVEQASTDALTRLANRDCFMTSTAKQLEQVIKRGGAAAMMMIDLDQFKEINDTMGHDAGDRFLQEVANRLSSIVGPDDLLARLGGDEFAVFTSRSPASSVAQELARALNAGLKKPFWPEGIQYFCSGSVGVAMYPEHGSTPQQLLRHADIAMYAAKSDHATGVRLYDPSMTTKAFVQLERRAQLERAVRDDRFELHYQPRVSLTTMKTVAVEALTRWRTEDDTLVYPSDFIELAERSGLIHPIGLWAVTQAVSDAVRLMDRSGAGIPIAINLSSKQFRHPELVSFIEEQLLERGVPAQCIEVEITESLLMDDSQLTQRHLQRFNELGIRIALDDFGTGYSNFAYLQELQIQTIKLDRRFVTGVEDNPRNARLVEAMLSMARSLGLTTVAEGVESQGTLEFLRARGCDEAQGFLLSKAVPIEELTVQLTAGLPEPRR